jgi:hypothetical protein
MAKVLDTFDFSRGRGPALPWDVWADGQIWRLTRGIDFHCQTTSLRALAISRRRNGRFRTSIIDENVVVIQFVKAPQS